MRRTSTMVVAIVMLECLVSCAKDPQPSKSDIEEGISARLPGFVHLSGVSVEAMENRGTKVDPLWQARFRATLTINTDTFAAESSDGAVTFVRSVKRNGDTIVVRSSNRERGAS